MIRDESIYIIAEAGVNHNGSLDMALDLVSTAAMFGADAVKFQTFKAERIASASAHKAAYQNRNTDPGQSQLDMLRKLELSPEAHDVLLSRCRECGIEFLSTPFDLESVDMLMDLGVSRLKIPSGELTNGPLLLKAASTGLPLIVSTGMSDLVEIEEALGVVAYGMLGGIGFGAPETTAFKAAYASSEGKTVLRERTILLHCTTEYPTPLVDVNLRAMDTLAETFGLRVGYSDHTEGVTVSIAAAARGACLIEKHFTMDRNLPGPDHKASLAPDELGRMIRGIRQVEMALGSQEKRAAPSEKANKAVARKSLVASTSISKGEPFTEANLTVKRPGTGISPMRWWEVLGTPASRDFQPDEVIEP